MRVIRLFYTGFIIVRGFTLSTFAQTERGTITGTVADPTNARGTRTYRDATGRTSTFDPAVGIPAGGSVAAGFGFVNTTTAPSTPASRQVQIVARLMF